MEGLVLKIFIVSILQCLQSNVEELFKLLILYWPRYLKASISLGKISWMPNMVFYLAMPDCEGCINSLGYMVVKE